MSKKSNNELKDAAIGPSLLRRNIDEALAGISEELINKFKDEITDIYELKNNANRNGDTKAKEKILPRVNDIATQMLREYMTKHPNATLEDIKRVPLFHHLQYFIIDKKKMTSSNIDTSANFNVDKAMTKAEEKVEELKDIKQSTPPPMKEEIKEKIEDIKEQVQDLKEAKREKDPEEIRDELKDLREELREAQALIVEAKKEQPPPVNRDLNESEKGVIKSLYAFYRRLVGEDERDSNEYDKNKHFMKVYNEAMKVYKNPSKYYNNEKGDKVSFIDIFKGALRLDIQRRNKKYNKITRAINSEVNNKTKPSPPKTTQNQTVNEKGDKVLTGTIEGDLKTSRSAIPQVKNPDFVQYKIVF